MCAVCSKQHLKIGLEMDMGPTYSTKSPTIFMASLSRNTSGKSGLDEKEDGVEFVLLVVSTEIETVSQTLIDC